MTTRRPVAQGGIFGASAQRPLSSQTKELLKVMMEESKLSNFQRRKLNENANKGQSLPIKVPPTCSAKEPPALIYHPAKKTFSMAGSRPTSMRTREDIEESGAYERPQFVPKPIRSLEVEKERLSNIMAFGEDVKPKSKEEILKEQREREKAKKGPDIDRFDEIQSEIEVRKKFLEDMEKIGQGKNYRSIINTQISGLIREMEIIDKQRCDELVNAVIAMEDRKQKS